MLSLLPKVDISTLQSLSGLASSSGDFTQHLHSIGECNGRAPRGIGDLYDVQDAINSIVSCSHPSLVLFISLYIQ
jgi:hypothetical protein